MTRKQFYTNVPAKSAGRLARLLKSEGAKDTRIFLKTDGMAMIIAFYDSDTRPEKERKAEILKAELAHG